MHGFFSRVLYRSLSNENRLGSDRYLFRSRLMHGSVVWPLLRSGSEIRLGSANSRPERIVYVWRGDF